MALVHHSEGFELRRGIAVVFKGVTFLASDAVRIARVLEYW